jgi:hypothetical protein
VLKSIALLPNYSFFLFLSTLSLCPQLPLPFSLSLSPEYPSLLHTHHLLTNILYQLYTIHPLQSLTQTPCITTTQIHPNTQKAHKTQQPLHSFSNHPTHFPPPLLVPSYPTPQISIASLTNANPHLQLPLLLVGPTRGLPYNI